MVSHVTTKQFRFVLKSVQNRTLSSRFLKFFFGFKPLCVQLIFLFSRTLHRNTRNIYKWRSSYQKSSASEKNQMILLRFSAGCNCVEYTFVCQQVLQLYLVVNSVFYTVVHFMVLISSVRFLVLSHEGRSCANRLNENTRRLPILISCH